MTATEKPRRRGRPATGQMPKRYFRADNALWEAVVAAAEMKGKTTSEYIRIVLERNVRRVLRARVD